MRGDSAVQDGEDVEDARDAAQSGKHAVLLGENGARGALVGINAGVGGGIAGGAIFLQCVFQEGGDPAACPIHDRSPRRNEVPGAKAPRLLWAALNAGLKAGTTRMSLLQQ